MRGPILSSYENQTSILQRRRDETALLTILTEFGIRVRPLANAFTRWCAETNKIQRSDGLRELVKELESHCAAALWTARSFPCQVPPHCRYDPKLVHRHDSTLLRVS